MTEVAQQVGAMLDEPFPGVYRAELGCRMVALLYDPGSRSGAIWVAHGECTEPDKARELLRSIDPDVEDLWVIEAPLDVDAPGKVLFVYSIAEGGAPGQWTCIEGLTAAEVAEGLGIGCDVPQFVYARDPEGEATEEMSAMRAAEAERVH